MGKNISITRERAAKIATKASGALCHRVHVEGDGLLHTTVEIDIDSAGLRRGKTETLIALLYEDATPTTTPVIAQAAEAPAPEPADDTTGAMESNGSSDDATEPDGADAGDADASTAPENEDADASDAADDEDAAENPATEPKEEKDLTTDGETSDESGVSPSPSAPVAPEVPSAGLPFASPEDPKNALVITKKVAIPKNPETKTIKVSYATTIDGTADTDAVLIVTSYRNKTPLIAALAVLALFAIAVAILLANWGDPRARKGYYEGKTKEEIQADLDSQVDWYSMEISCASAMTMLEGQTEVDARIENVVNNHCDQKVKMYLTGSPDDVLYESGAIAPGEYIQTVPLKRALPVGRHAVTVEFQGYDQSPTLLSNEGKILGHDTFGASCAAQVTIEVLPAGSELPGEEGTK